MKLKEFLIENKIIKESALAVLMWPDKNNQAKVFSNKINEKATGKTGSKQRITENDEVRAKVVLLEVSERIKAYAGERVDVAPSIQKEHNQPTQKTKTVEKQEKKEPTKAELFKEIVRAKSLK
jgi:DNA-directed RNA polymerase subunit E'/Rpb7